MGGTTGNCGGEVKAGGCAGADEEGEGYPAVLASAAELTGGVQFKASHAVAVDEACFDERDEYAHIVSVKLELVS